MRRPLIVALAILLALGLLLWLTSTLGSFYAGIATLNPWLARLLTALVTLLLAAAAVTVGYYGWLFLRPRRGLPPPPKTPQAAATAQLQSLDQLLGQIEDRVARQALAERARGVVRTFESQVLRLVIVGSGSVGKTSLANALMGEIAGETGVIKGTTRQSQDYRIDIPAIDGEVLLTDSPGLLDGSPEDTATRDLATRADLVLYVLDNDLHRSQYEVVTQLLALGKRTLVVLNKIDLYPDADVETILTQLRQRLPVQPADVVAVAASPRGYPTPVIDELVERIVAILRSEGRDLMADNILLQSQRLSREAQQLLGQQRQQQADRVVDRYQWIGAGVLAATPLPVVDMLATAAVNTQMVIDLGKVYGVEVSIEDARELAGSLAKTMASLGIIKGALRLLSIGLQASVAAAVAGKLIQGVSAAYLTRIAGKSFMEYFENQQGWGDGGIQAVVEKHYRLNRREELVQRFVQSALASLKSQGAT